MIGVPYNEPNTPPFELAMQVLLEKKRNMNELNIHCECTPSHVLKGQLAISGLQTVSSATGRMGEDGTAKRTRLLAQSSNLFLNIN